MCISLSCCSNCFFKKAPFSSKVLKLSVTFDVGGVKLYKNIQVWTMLSSNKVTQSCSSVNMETIEMPADRKRVSPDSSHSSNSVCVCLVWVMCGAWSRNHLWLTGEAEQLPTSDLQQFIHSDVWFIGPWGQTGSKWSSNGFCVDGKHRKTHCTLYRPR